MAENADEDLSVEPDAWRSGARFSAWSCVRYLGHLELTEIETAIVRYLGIHTWTDR